MPDARESVSRPPINPGFSQAIQRHGWLIVCDARAVRITRHSANLADLFPGRRDLHRDQADRPAGLGCRARPAQRPGAPRRPGAAGPSAQLRPARLRRRLRPDHQPGGRGNARRNRKSRARDPIGRRWTAPAPWSNASPQGRNWSDCCRRRLGWCSPCCTITALTSCASLPMARPSASPASTATNSTPPRPRRIFPSRARRLLHSEFMRVVEDAEARRPRKSCRSRARKRST